MQTMVVGLTNHEDAYYLSHAAIQDLSHANNCLAAGLNIRNLNTSKCPLCQCY